MVKIIAICGISVFRYSDFGICGEYQDIVPELIEKVKEGFSFGVEVK